MLAVADQVPVAGSYSSAVSRVVPLFVPPATRTLALSSSVAVWVWRAVVMLPVAVQVFGAAWATAVAPSAPSRVRTMAIIQARAGARVVVDLIVPAPSDGGPLA